MFMVHRVRRKDDKYLVSAIMGTSFSPEVETVWIPKSEVPEKISELKRKPRVRQITVQKGGLVDYLRGFTLMGEAQVVRRIRRDIPNRTEVVYLAEPKGMYGETKVIRVK